MPVSLGACVASILATLALPVFVCADEPRGLDPRKAITQYGLDVWTTDEGLPNATVNAIVQTRDGYLWLGTHDGLARFDGVHFTVFNTSNTPGLGGNGIRALCEDSAGSLWIGTNGGGLSRLMRGRFTHYSVADGLPSDIVWALRADVRDGGVWVGTNGGGLARFHEGRFHAYPVADSGRSISSIAQGPEGSLWVSSFGDGLRRLSPDGRWTTFTAKEGLPGNIVTTVAVDRDGALWVGTAGGGVTRLKGDRLSALPAVRGLGVANVTAIHEDREGTLWIGTNGGGLARYRGGRLTVMTAEEGLPENVVYALFEDGEGTLWIGTNGGGLGRLRDGSFTALTTREGLSRDFCYTSFEDRSGTLWVGTAGGLDRLEGGDWTQPAPDARPQGVRSIAEDRKGGLWFGTYGAGVWRFLAGRWTSYSTRDGLAQDSVRAVLADRAGRVWAATIGGLSVFENGRWRTYRTEHGLPNDSLIGLAEDREGSLWIGTDGAGLCRFRNGRFEVFTTRDGLAADLVLALHQDDDGVLWVGTNGGLSRFRNGRFDTFTAAAGLPSDAVTQIVDDGRGHLWIGTSKGASRVAKSSLEQYARGQARRLDVVTFGRADGMKSTQCTAPGHPAGRRGRDGRLWFATARGVAVVDPADLRRDTQPPPVVIEEVTIDGRSVAPGDAVLVPPGAGRVQFRYTGLCLLSPARVTFRFRLDGFDDGWVDAGDRRLADYTGVRPGDYVFRVTAANADGVWNETGTSVALRVAPRLYQTRAFAAGIALTMVGLVVAGHRLRVRRFEARQRALTLLVEERTRKLAEEKERAERLLAAAHALGATMDLQQVLARILSELQQVVPYDSASIQALRGDQLYVIAGRGFADVESLLGLSFDLGSGENANLADVVRTRAPLILEDAWSSFSGFRKEPHAQAAIRSWLGVPLLFGERLIGMLTLDKKEVAFYAADHARVALAFAAQAAIAIENARLYSEARLEIEERRRAEEALQKSETRYRELVENASEIIYRTDPAGRFTYVNPTTVRMSGFSEAELLGKSFQELVRPDWREKAAESCVDQYHNLIPTTYSEWPILTKDGREVWLGCSIHLLLDEQGAPVAFHAIDRDITDRKHLERLREDLTHAMVHDLRSPLTTVLGSLEFLSSSATLHPEDLEMVQIAEHNAQRQLRLINAILDVTQLESGSMPLARRDVALSLLVSEALELLTPQALAKETRLVSEVSPTLAAAWIDRDLMGRVLQNLIGNAIKFTPRGGEVRVSAGAQTPNMLLVRVSDTGPGVPEDLKGRLFQKFATGQQHGHGTGLGLAFCRLVVEAHGGRIWVETTPGQGATFALALPVGATGPGEEEPQHSGLI